MEKQKGKASVLFENPPLVLAAASVVGKKEGEGPLGEYFDRIEVDPMLGKKTWEQAESELQTRTTSLVIEKSGLKKEDIRYYFGGDLLAQLIATSFSVMDMEFPMFGIYGACSTMGEAMGLGSMVVDGGFADHIVVTASSHFASAEKQFRFPLEYANQRPKSATWTVTGSGAFLLTSEEKMKEWKVSPLAKITGITTGKIVDFGIKDSMNMGAAMAPAALSTIRAHFDDLGTCAEDFDLIVTGDLGQLGKEVLLAAAQREGINLGGKLADCGTMVFDILKQDVHSGGSGCGCSAITLCGELLNELNTGKLSRILFCGTGALLSPTSTQQGLPIPGVCHAISISGGDV